MLVAGNLFDTEVETTQYDAGKGLILKNNFPDSFSTQLNSTQTGLMLSDNVRVVKPISLTSNAINGFLVGNNNSDLQILLMANE